MNILVTGGTGMVGRQLPFGIKTDFSQLNILLEESVNSALRRYRPDVVVHLAANANMVDCEKNPGKAYRTNVTGTYNVAKACGEFGVRLVYLSSCTVFSGQKRSSFEETDPPNPLSVYARTKLAGEWIVQDLAARYLIVRTGWLFGGGRSGDKKFVGLCLRKFEAGKGIIAISDRHGSPTYVPDLANALYELIICQAGGIVHLVNSGSASYFEIAKFLKESGNFDVKVEAGNPLAGMPYQPPRGRHETLSSKTKTMRPWQEALSEYVKKWKNY